MMSISRTQMILSSITGLLVVAIFIRHGHRSVDTPVNQSLAPEFEQVISKSYRPQPSDPRPSNLEDPESRSRKLYFQATSLADPSRAILLLQDALRSDPSFESALERIARLYSELHQWGQARESASECLNVNPRNPTCYHTYVDALLGEGNSDLAADAIQDCLVAIPQDFVCLREARSYFLRDGDRSGFDEFLNQTYASIPNETDRLLQISAFNWQVGERSRAIQGLLDACALGSIYACTGVEKLRSA